MKRAVIFDLDGTLWNATKTIYKALLELQQELGLPLSSYELLCSLMGQPMNIIADHLLPTLSEEERYALMPSFYQKEMKYLRAEGGVLFPHMVEVLNALKKRYPLFIVSNCQKGYIETFLQVHEVEDLFLDHLCWGERKVPKGENILALMKSHHLEGAIYVGDTRGDEEGAALAGIPFIFVDFGFGNALHPDFTMSDYRQLPDIVNSLWGNVEK